METKYGVNVKIEGLGNVKVEGSNNLSKLKQMAIKAFKLSVVQAVCVFDGSGNALFYLKRLENGSVYKEEILGVRSITGRVQVRVK